MPRHSRTGDQDALGLSRLGLLLFRPAKTMQRVNRWWRCVCVLNQGRLYSCTYQCKQGFLISSIGNKLLYKKERSYRINQQRLVHLHINCEHSVCQLGSDTLLLGIIWQRKWSAHANELQRNIERQILSTVSALSNLVESAEHSHA